jgi:hypothetical protein
MFFSFPDTYEMITECSEGGYQFVVSYHFESNMRAAGERSHPSRVKRLAQETVTLSTSLPLSYSSSVFVRCDTDRLDIMKVRYFLIMISINLYIPRTEDFKSTDSAWLLESWTVHLPLQ